jgi:CheY-like chemotaxis protein
MLRVLIVDDVPVIAELLQAYIGEDAQVTLVTDDFAALTSPLHPVWAGTDILVCDLMLPVVSGLQILETARAHHPHITRITLTGASGPLLDAAAELSDHLFMKTAPLSSILTAILQ